MVEMTVESVRINLATQQRVVILKALRQERYLFIWIAHAEAYAIAIELQGASSPRPLTHDLLKNVITELGAKIMSVVISDLIDDIFYARIILDADGRHVEIDARPSDAIALAIRAKAPIYVEESVLERAGVTPETSEEQSLPKTPPKKEPEPDNLEAYRDFINSLDVLDEFGKD
ncbi:MAG: bifunctional nuclease family protein [Thermogemmatispora sp.]|jgi:bifunctional DNase/RNase|uniref:BFN domain-containing protein n=4 Tax=Thermogemmatispora TaxID=768669 RepID=A0A328VHE5_9CHLR|nr:MULTISPECIES: bifunctional nuclease family protein [Thermogemmatispora]BBH95637.1 hypothetical protein KTA_38360 [Thermogemmatispora argillosa]MBE3567983.1 bifunctional nuclease family protein [Thermogemmatispora sp.]MBX5457074.1 bifunctional nuclease family protein [Thermogemmatispora sp.]RAQ95063.1 hypothetical protein A4R35_05910 [Thermogemmatispora tikiterensis]GER81413.1 hypothetical protein KTAU_00520 [Thermogemmatispora aurantia]